MACEILWKMKIVYKFGVPRIRHFDMNETFIGTRTGYCADIPLKTGSCIATNQSDAKRRILFRDKSLLRKMAAAGKPVVASSGGAEERHIDELVQFFAGRGIPFALNHCVSLYPSEDGELEPQMYTVSRELNAQVSLRRFLDDEFGMYNTTRQDQVMPGITRARMMTDSLYKIAAPMAINKALNIEAAQDFLKNNLFVFTKYPDMQAVFKRGAKGKQRNLCHTRCMTAKEI